MKRKGIPLRNPLLFSSFSGLPEGGAVVAPGGAGAFTFKGITSVRGGGGGAGLGGVAGAAEEGAGALGFFGAVSISGVRGSSHCE